MTNADPAVLTKRAGAKARRQVAGSKRADRVQAHLLRGKAAKEAARQARVEAEARGADAEEIAAVTHAASQRVIQMSLDSFLSA